jgi:hypothetical protein
VKLSAKRSAPSTTTAARYGHSALWWPFVGAIELSIA